MKKSVLTGDNPFYVDDMMEESYMTIIHNLLLSTKMKKLMRLYLDWRKKNPGQGAHGAIEFVRQLGPSYTLRDGNELIDAINDAVKKGKLPKHLALKV